jgi:hypothetical protein
LHPYDRGCRVDVDPSHLRQVDHEATVVDGIAGHVVSTAPDRKEKVVLAREVHRVDDVCGTAALRDDRRPAVDQAVPDQPRVLVTGVVRSENGSAHLHGECLQRLWVNGRNGRSRRAHRSPSFALDPACSSHRRA